MIEYDRHSRESKMKDIGVIGLGDMGSGLAKNLIKGGFTVRGCDLSEKRVAAFEAMGGEPMPSAADLGAQSDAVFVMVMTGDRSRAGAHRHPGIHASGHRA